MTLDHILNKLGVTYLRADGTSKEIRIPGETLNMDVVCNSHPEDEFTMAVKDKESNRIILAFD